MLFHASLLTAINMSSTTDCKWLFFSFSLLSTARSDSTVVGSDRLLSTIPSRSRLSFSAALNLSLTTASRVRSPRNSCVAIALCSRRPQHEFPAMDGLCPWFADKASRTHVMISTRSRFCKTAVGTPVTCRSPSNARASSALDADCAINRRSRSLSAVSRRVFARSRPWTINNLSAIDFSTSSSGDRLSHTRMSLTPSIETGDSFRPSIVSSSILSCACACDSNASSTIRATYMIITFRCNEV